MMLIDLRNKGSLVKKLKTFGKAEITVNKKIWFHLMINHHL
jgi:hypothetical protein